MEFAVCKGPILLTLNKGEYCTLIFERAELRRNSTTSEGFESYFRGVFHEIYFPADAQRSLAMLEVIAEVFAYELRSLKETMKQNIQAASNAAIEECMVYEGTQSIRQNPMQAALPAYLNSIDEKLDFAFFQSADNCYNMSLVLFVIALRLPMSPPHLFKHMATLLSNISCLKKKRRRQNMVFYAH